MRSPCYSSTTLSRGNFFAPNHSTIERREGLLDLQVIVSPPFKVLRSCAGMLIEVRLVRREILFAGFDVPFPCSFRCGSCGSRQTCTPRSVPVRCPLSLACPWALSARSPCRGPRAMTFRGGPFRVQCRRGRVYGRLHGETSVAPTTTKIIYRGHTRRLSLDASLGEGNLDRES